MNNIKDKLFFIVIIINVLIISFNKFVFFQKSTITPIFKNEIINKNYQLNNSEISNTNYLTITNSDNEPDSIAEIIIQNNIDYIPKISVIIPVYNTELYLDQCLETVINQTLKEIEIICVDDGSTDNSLDILIEYARKDSRITILKQDNLNAGIARNAGLLIAKGNYLSFLDSDDWFEFNMLEEMYNKIIYTNADIAICRCKSFDYENGIFNERKLDFSLKKKLIPQNDPFFVTDISNNIFQFCEGWAWDKLFRADLIRDNNIKFQSLINTNDQEFTFTSLCYAKTITTIDKRLIIKRHKRKNSLSSNKNKDPSCFNLCFEKIKTNLEIKGLFDLFKESYWRYVIHFNLNQLKYLGYKSKSILYNILHQKIKLWDYIDDSPQNSNVFWALHYLKNYDVFPTINIAYATNEEFFNLCLVSILSLLKNSEYENINIILLYNNLTYSDITKINELKIIRNFTFETVYISNDEFINYPLTQRTSKEIWYRTILADKFPNIDKILYLDSDTIIRKSLLPLWEVNLDDNLIAAVEDISMSKYKAKKHNLKDNLYINSGVLLINTKKWRENKLFKKIGLYVQKNNNILNADQDALNILTDNKKIRLNPEFNYMEVWWRNNSNQYNYEYAELYKKKTPTIVHFVGIKPTNINCNNSYRKEFLKYYSISHNLNKSHLIIPIVLSSDDNYAPFMYTTLLSILKNSYAKTFYVFFLLVPPNFSNKYQNLILKLTNIYKCSIHFIIIKNSFEYITLKISHITLSTFYRLLIGDLLPLEIDKCIYLDTDIYVAKDLSELYNIDIEDYYIAGVISPSYYFNEQVNCKRLNLPSMKKYINAGVMLMNLKQIRSDNMTLKFIELTKNNYNSQDQDVLNVACYGKILILPPKYNAMVKTLKENNPLLRNLYTEQEITEAKNSPFIIHYADKFKPWNTIGLYMEKYWWNIAKQTPFIENLFNREKIYKYKLIKWWFKIKNRILNIENPRTFNEKIQWLKMYDTTPIKTYLSDKYFARRWVKDKIGEEHLVPLLGIYNKFEEIEFGKLPESFIIRCNHGRDYTIIVKDKSKLNLADVEIKLDKWMNENYAFKNGLELQYTNIEHKIIIEKYIEDYMNDLKDYSFLCFNGNPEFILFEPGNYIKILYNLYELNSNQLPYILNEFSISYTDKKKLKLLNKMIDLSKELSEDFIFTKINFFIVNKKIYFSQILFTPVIDIDNIKSVRLKRKLGNLIKLPNIIYNIDTEGYYEFTKIISLSPFYFLLIIFILKLLCLFNII